MDAQVKQRSASPKRKKPEPFVQVPWWWIKMAAKAASSPATLVLVELLYARWKAKSSTFSLPNSRLKALGVSRDVKRRVLRDLERRQVILVKRSARKTPIITLIGL